MAETKKFGLLNTAKKEIVTHAELQKKETVKRGGRPKKSDKEKLNSTICLNVNEYEREILEAEAASIGLNIVSLARMSLNNAQKNNFTPTSIQARTENVDRNKGSVVKQYSISVTDDTKAQLEQKASELTVSVSDLLKMSLRISGYYNI